MGTHLLIHNTEAHRYEYRIGEHTAYIEYLTSDEKGPLYLTHTNVPSALGGQGIGSALVTDVLRHIEQNGLQIVPICPFIREYIQKHPEWEHLLASPGNSSSDLKQP